MCNFCFGFLPVYLRVDWPVTTFSLTRCFKVLAGSGRGPWPALGKVLAGSNVVPIWLEKEPSCEFWLLAQAQLTSGAIKVGHFFCDKNSNRVFVSNNERVQIPFHVRFGKPYVPERYPFHTCCSWCVWYTHRPVAFLMPPRLVTASSLYSWRDLFAGFFLVGCWAKSQLCLVDSLFIYFLIFSFRFNYFLFQLCVSFPLPFMIFGVILRSLTFCLLYLSIHASKANISIWRDFSNVPPALLISLEPSLISFFAFFPLPPSFLLFRAAPTTSGGSQARGWMRAIAASLRHSHCNARSGQNLQPTPQLTARLAP